MKPKHRLIAIRFSDDLPETEPLVMIPHTTFDQAREALKAIEMAYENRGEETSLYVWNERMKQAIYQVRKALAAMEDAGR